MKRSRRWMRRAAAAACCLGLGFIMTVGTAWAIAYWLGEAETHVVTYDGPVRWPGPIPVQWAGDDWMSPNHDRTVMALSVYRDFGRSETRFMRGDVANSRSYSVHKFGFPARCLRYDELYHHVIFAYPGFGWWKPQGLSRGLSLDESDPVLGYWPGRRLPIAPVWHGLIADTGFYAAMLYVMTLVPRWLRRAIRVRRGQCPRCGYPKGTAPVCTECGVAL